VPERSRPDSRHDISRSKFDKWRFLAYNPGKCHAAGVSCEPIRMGRQAKREIISNDREERIKTFLSNTNIAVKIMHS